MKEILDFKEKNVDYKKLSVDEIVILKNYITNLQEKNKRLKEELLQEKKDFKEANDYCFELKDYKLRNEKAIEYIIKNFDFYYGDELFDCYQEVINILKGDNYIKVNEHYGIYGKMKEGK